MTVRKEIPHHHGLYFITFTCCRWIPLIAEADAYYAVYKWFDYLKAQGHYIIAYVIMPNHLHLLLAFYKHARKIDQYHYRKRQAVYGIRDCETAKSPE